MIYKYDGTYEGMISAIKVSFEQEETNAVFKTKNNDIFDLFEDIVDVKTESKDAHIWVKDLSEKSSPDLKRDIFFFFIAKKEKMEKLISEYIQLAMVHGPDIDDLLTNDTVRNIKNTSRKVGSEIHRVKGLLRFSERTDGTAVAFVGPDNDIVPFLTGYFKKRFSFFTWTIYDRKRGYGIKFDHFKKTLKYIDYIPTAKLSKEEEKNRNLWKKYFNSTAIQERKNPVLQRKNMPKRYWEDLVEMQD